MCLQFAILNVLVLVSSPCFKMWLSAKTVSTIKAAEMLPRTVHSAKRQ